jgi:nickel-dependent lactate racemase
MNTGEIIGMQNSSSVIGWGYTNRVMPDDEAKSILAETFARWDLSGRRVLILLPDGTRTAPVSLMFHQICEALYGRAARLDFMIALGTHRAMSDEALDHHLGISQAQRLQRYPAIGVYQHEWRDPQSLLELGKIPIEKLHAASNGVLPRDVPVQINRRILDYDVIVICGPVFPHEVIGYSGGSVYLFPGISGLDILDAIHMVEGLLTSRQVIGRKWTPARQLLDRAMEMVPCSLFAVNLVVIPESYARPGGLVGLYTGEVTPSWSAAADLSAQVNVNYVEKPYQKVLSIVPKMYEDLWTGAKGMFKVDPAVADGGEVIIYAPHISELSFSHGHILRETGYHVIDYFTKQWERYKDYPIGVLSHATEVVGCGRYENGIETRRIRLRMATGISPELCKQVGLEYLDPAGVHPEDYAGRETEGTLLIPKAGEILYQLKSQQSKYNIPLEFSV